MEPSIVPSTCWECSTLCGSLLTVESGRVTRIAPNPGHPASRGAFCVKGIRGAADSTYEDTRLTHPLRRVGPRGSGQWARVSWDDALDEMADKFAAVADRHGAQSMVGAVGGAAFSRGPVVALLMRSLGSPNWMINQDMCGGCRAVSDRLTGLRIGGGADIEDTRCALIVGRNPYAADPIQWMALKRGKARGMTMIVIDPFKTPAAAIADLWLRPHPGTDAAIALGMIRVMITEGLYDAGFVERWCHGFDELRARADAYTPEHCATISGVPAEDIVRAARMYADGPSTFVSGHGIDAFSAGVQTFRAFHSLIAISGNLGRPGGSPRVRRPAGFLTPMDLLHDKRFQLDGHLANQTLGADRFPLWAGPKGWQTACHNPTVIDAILTGAPHPVRAMYASGVNFVVTYPDPKRTAAALLALDVFVVAAHTMNPTAAFADLVLPKTTGLEEEEVSLHPSSVCITYTAPASGRVGEVRPDIEIAAGLRDRMRARGKLHAELLPWSTQAELNAFLVADTGIDMAELRRTGFSESVPPQADFAGDGFATPTGKIELYSETLSNLGLDPLPAYTPAAAKPAGYPLVLQTGQREKTYHHSRFREQAWAKKVSPDPQIWVHPATAAAQDLRTGDWIAVETPGSTAACRLQVAISANTLPDVLTTGMGWWDPNAAGPFRGADDINVNTVLNYGSAGDPMTGSIDTRGVPCRITRIAAAAAA